jgi:hypothetical protein
MPSVRMPFASLNEAERRRFSPHTAECAVRSNRLSLDSIPVPSRIDELAPAGQSAVDSRESRVKGRLLLACALSLIACSFAGSADAASPGGPFYLVPSATTECNGIKNCVGTRGPWVAVPTRGAATYLFGCPKHLGFVVAGTDARASSGAIRVWFDDRTGGRIGPAVNEKGSAVLLFHATSDDGSAGWFQPIVGCVSLIPKNKRSTTAIDGGVPPSAPGRLRAESLVPLANADLGVQRKGLACPANERAVSSWSAFGLFTSNPPDSAFDDAITIRTELEGRRVLGRFHLNRSFSILAPRLWVQIGAVCEP